MAEALCGPSNALQNLQKHSSVDKTLQQDRLALRNSPSQSFRSSPGPGAAHLDAEFQVFQNGQAVGGPQLAFQHEPFVPFASAFNPAPQSNLAGWASDFQKLHLNETRTSPIPAARFRQEAPLQRNSPSAWGQEFLRQHEQSQFQQPVMSQDFGALGWQPQYSGVDFISPMAQHQPPAQAADVFDEAAFAQAFDAAQLEMDESASKGKDVQQEVEQPEQFSMEHACTEPGDILGDYDYEAHLDELEQEADSLQQLRTMRRDGGWEALNAFERAHEQEIQDTNSQVSRDIVDAIRAMRIEEEADRAAWAGPTSDEVRIGADTILAPELEQEAPMMEADELSRTAGELLDNLKDEQSRKFQQSNFMELMRQLRDKEVRVEGDKMVNITQEHHPGGKFYPYDAFETTADSHFTSMPAAAQATA